MKKYKLINNQTKEEYLCDKVTIDGFDYYVSDEIILTGDYKYHHVTGLRKAFVDGNYTNQKKVIATNNPNIDIPKVVDEVEKFAEKMWDKSLATKGHRIGFTVGYNKSQETHPFSEEDMIEFGEWCEINYSYNQKKKYWYKYTDKTDDIKPYTTKELLQLWKEQQPKIIYYE